MEGTERLAWKLCLSSKGVDVSELSPSVRFCDKSGLLWICWSNHSTLENFQVPQGHREALTCSKKWINQKSGSCCFRIFWELSYEFVTVSEFCYFNLGRYLIGLSMHVSGCGNRWSKKCMLKWAEENPFKMI